MKDNGDGIEMIVINTKSSNATISIQYWTIDITDLLQTNKNGDKICVINKGVIDDRARRISTSRKGNC